MIFETERLILRPWVEDDAEDLFLYAGDDRVGPSAGWPAHTDVSNSRQIIRDVLSDKNTFAVCLKQDGKPIGSIGLFSPTVAHTDMIKPGELEVGYWIGVPFWGKGYIPEAVKCMQWYAFSLLNIQGMWCGYFEGNEKSKRVQEKCGFLPHHKEENKLWKITGEIKTEYFTYITREAYYSSFEGLKQPYKIIVDDNIKLVSYYDNFDESLKWYQDEDLCLQIDNKRHKYSQKELENMYRFLCENGSCFYIEYNGILVGDITLRDNNEICITVCKEYQNRHIGRKTVAAIAELAKNKGLTEICANIYSFNIQSRKMFQNAGFEKTGDEWFRLVLQ